MNTIDIHYVKIDVELPDYRFNSYLDRLPLPMQERNRRFLRWKDRHANLMGKILLLEGLSKFGVGRESLHAITYNDYGKPFLNGVVNFNISHSEDYVICAISETVRIGVDIEKIHPVEFENFTNVMTPGQWKEIHESPDNRRKFFTYWVIKESVIKADSRGLSIPLQEIKIKTEMASVDLQNQSWYIHLLDFCSTDYCAALAANIKVDKINFVPFQHHNAVVAFAGFTSTNIS